MTEKQSELIQFENYTREQVRDILAPQTGTLQPASSWAFRRVVQILERPNDWVFFVTFRNGQSHHTFEEGISLDGVLQWQSDPRKTLSDPVIMKWIHHNARSANIYLFLRTQRSRPYWYLGKLAYVSHDEQLERPVHFIWQILEWNPPAIIRSQVCLPENTRVHIAISVQRHFSYLQKFSEALTIMSPIQRYRNNTQGIKRLAQYATGATLNVRWHDLAQLPLTKLLPDDLRKSLIILPGSDSQLPTQDIAKTLRSIAVQTKEPHAKVAKTKIARAEQIGLDYQAKLHEFRQTQNRTASLLQKSFPEFLDVFHRWRSKGALWVLENYPTPAEILARPTTEIQWDLNRITRGHVPSGRAIQLHQAAHRALVDQKIDADSFHAELEQSLAAIQEVKNALDALHTLQRTLQTTEDFPRRRTLPKRRNSRQPRRNTEPLKRTGGRYHTLTERATLPDQNRMHVDIACRQYSAGWQVLLVAGNSHEVVQNGRALKQLEPGVWVLESLDPVVVDGRQVSIREQVMIFRLSETVSGYRGKRVENVSRNSNHLIIASDELTIQGSNPIDALGIPGYQSVLVGQNSPVHLVQKDGSDLLLVQHEAIVKLELIGHKAPFCSLQTPLFIRDFPSITGETSAPVTIIAGYEGTGTPHWRASVSFNGGITKLPTPPSKLGWFFVRCYDARNVLLEGEGLDFYWIRGMNGISWDSTHAELVFSHDHTLIVDTLSPTLHVQRQSHETRCRLPLGPEHNQTWWRVTDREDVRQYIEVPITVPRNQWGLGPEDSPTNLHWTQEPLVIPANLVKATSTQTLHIAVSREQPLKNPTIILWVGSNRMAPVRLHGDQAMIPLRNLISHVPTIMDRPLPLRFTVASNHQLDNPTTLGQITMMFSCGRCSTEFDSTSALQQHIRQIHPILLKEASTYAAYYSMATRAGLADKLPAKVYRCIRCGHIEVADNPHVNNATSAMDRHFNQEHRGGTVLSLRVINDTAEIAQLFNRILEPLGECPECRSVFQVNHHAVWNAHRDKHYSEWITRR